MHNNIPLWFQTWQCSSFDTGHVNSVIPAGFSKWSCFHANISLGAVFAYVNNAFGNWGSAHCLIPVFAWLFPSSHTIIFKKTCGTLESFPSILHHWTHSGPLSPTSPRCAPASNTSHAQLQKSGLKNIIMQKLEKNCNASTQREQWDCSFTEEQEKRREIPLYRLRHVTVTWICTQLHVNGNNSGIFISL